MARLGTTGRVAATYLLLAGLQRGVSLLILPFVTHAMSPAEYGAASMLTASSALLVAILAGPIDTLVLRAQPRGGDDAPGLLRVAGIYCYVLLPVIAALIATGFALVVPTFLGLPGFLWALEILAIGYSSAMTMFALPMVKARQDLPRFVWLAGSSVVFAAVSKLVLVVVWQLGLLGWVISDLISAVLSAAVAMALVRPPRACVTQDHVHGVIRFAVPLIPHHAAFWAITSLSLPALAMVSTFTQVGLLSVGLSIASTANFVLAEINRAVQPRYSREKFPAPSEHTSAPVKWQIVLAMAVPAAVGVVLVLVGQWVFAEPYWRAFALTGVLLVAQTAYGLYPIAMNYLVLTAGLPQYSAFASVTGAAVILGSIFIFGRDYGSVGVAYATTAGYSAMAAVAILLTRLTRLDISWRAWAVCWPEIAISTAALACSVAALSCPVGSSSGRIFAGGCVGLLLGGLFLVTRHRPIHE